MQGINTRPSILISGKRTLYPAKITRPKPQNIIERLRLFNLLDKAWEKPITWVSAPAGSGKTTLIASYLNVRKIPCLWYQCDEGDTDLATFFYYMGLAAQKANPRYKKPLPLLTLEYLAGIPTFTRRYFENLFGRLVPRDSSRLARHGFSIVLDNYQDVSVNSSFHDMIANGLDLIPEGVHVVVISRNDPPSSLARLQANDKINLLYYRDIRFSFDESKELVHGRIPMLDIKTIQVMLEKTEGWAAGIILMLVRERLEGPGTESPADITYDKVFDYFAGEIFNKSDKEVQAFLLKTAFLPRLTVPLAEKLTGFGNAGRILSALNRQHYFTEKIAGSGQSYQYHPLFRDFLLNRVKTEFAPDTLAIIQREAALLLEQSGQIEDAARLYRDAGDRQGLSRMVIQHARDLLLQGRNNTVQEWIAGIPGESADDSPWLLYWTGMCSFPFDMPRSRSYLEKAFAAFKRIGDTSGIYLSWVGIVDTYGFALDEWKRLDDWIAVFVDLKKTYPTISSKEIDLIVSSRMLMALTLRKIDQPQMIHGWLERVSALLQENPSFAIQMDIVFFMSVYHLWKGEYNKNAILLDRMEAEICCHQPSPFAVIRIKLMKGIHYWVTAQYESALNTLSEGLDISGQSGVHIYDSMLWSFRAAAEMAPGNMEMAEKSLKNQRASLLKMAKTLDIFFYHVNSAWYAILTGNPSLAVENLEVISVKVEKMGTPYYRALWNIGMAQAILLQDRLDEAKTYVQTAHRISLEMKSHVMEWYSLLISAYFLLLEGKEEEGLPALRRGLSLGKRYGYVHLQFYQPSVMQFLFARALEVGIEQEYVKGLIRKLKLTPPELQNLRASVCNLENWPYPVKIYALGRFEISRDDEPMRFSGKVQQKPLDLLKALIAFGGMDVPEERLTDALWPDADGDLAHKSFETTLSRLRRLLGEEDVIIYCARQLTMNPLYCWADSLAFEQLFGKIREVPADQAVQLCEKAVGLYKGPFLASDIGLSWAVSKRETLKNRLLRILLMLGRHYEQADQWEKAAVYYEKGLETDNLAEEYYQRLMSCNLRLGRRSEAMALYNRCRSLLKAEFGIEPSPATTAIYSSIIQKQ